MNNQNAPLVSIIVPVYKTELYLRACLDSVYGQTYKNFEVICIDDGSPDNSISILKQFKQEHENFRYYSQNNQGLSATRNNGIRLDKGKYILPLDSDDILDYDCLKKLVEAVENGECDISTPEIVYFYPDEHLYHYLGAKPTPCNMAQSNYICCTSLFPKSYFELYGGYDIDNFKKGMEDYDLWCRYIENGKKIKRINTALFYYRVKDETESMRLQFEKSGQMKQYRKILYNKYSFVRKYTSLRYIVYKQIVRYTKRYFKYIYQKKLEARSHRYNGILFSKIKLFSKKF